MTLRTVSLLLFAGVALAGCTQYDLAVGGATAVAMVVDSDADGGLAPTAAVSFPGQITFDGSMSYSGSEDTPATSFTWTWYDVPDGCEWAIGSSDGFDTPHGEQSPVTPPVIGAYMASLEAAGDNTAGSENLAVATGFAVNLQGLEVRLTWDKDTTDMDLHLINGGALQGNYWTDADCYFGNPTPDWGMAGEGVDDPILLEDIDSGYGPESINILAPADGTYAVAVAYHNDWDTGVSATPQVSLWYDGAELHTFVGTALDEGDVQFMGIFDWPFTQAVDDGSIQSHTALGGDPYNQT